MGNLAGAPRKFKSVDELNHLIDEYLKLRIKKDKPITFLSFCVFANASKDTINEYQRGTYDDDNNKFSESMKKFKEVCEMWAEEQLFTNPRTAGVIFNLKNNFGWKDKTEVEHQVTNIDVKINNLIDEADDKPLLNNPTT